MSTAPTSTAPPHERAPDYTVVKLYNHGPEEFVGQYAGDTYRCEPERTIFVPFTAMCIWAGHPDAVDIDRKRRYRTDELKRLQVKYGTYSFSGCWTTDVCTGNPDKDGTKKHPPTRHLPNISFLNVEDDTEFPTVLADPQGKGVSSNVISGVQQDDLASRAVTELRDQVNNLQRELAAVQRSQGIPTPEPAPGGNYDLSDLMQQDDEDVDEDAEVEGANIPDSTTGTTSTTRKPRIPPAPGPA